MTFSSVIQTCTKKYIAIVAIVSGMSMVLFIEQMKSEHITLELVPWKMKSAYFRGEGKIVSKVTHEAKGRTFDGDIVDKWKQTQFERIKHFREQCQMYKLKTEQNVSSSIEVFYSQKYKLAYRPIPKIRSTFMVQVIFLLSNKGHKKPFDMARSDVHKMRKNYSNISKRFTVESLNGYHVLVVARNPYTRIYSAYVDKVYIFNSLALCKDIYSKSFVKKNKTRTCKFNISFEEFLDYILHADTKVISDHYNPIMSPRYGNKICKLSDIRIVKQETFSEDIDHALKSVNVTGNMYDKIYDEMNSKHSETTIGSIVKTVYKKFSSSIQRNSCLTWKEIAVRLWKSFQIQGYIHEDSEFPETKFENKYESSENLIRVMINELQNRTLTHDEKIQQRNKALLKAYASVDEKYLGMIRKRYAMDFDMFGYNTDVKVIKD